MTSESLIETSIGSGEFIRKAWVQFPIAGIPKSAALFLDAEIYIERVDAPTVMRSLQADQSIPPMLAVYLSHNGSAARHHDFTCNEQYAEFVATEVLPWVRRGYGLIEPFPVVIAGLSLSGLAAAYISLRYPQCFSAAICQSPSFWWENEKFRESVPGISGHGPKLWISVGDQETVTGASHPPTGMLQQSSQIDSCRRTFETLTSRGHQVQYREFSGGHDPNCWRDDLRLALARI